MEEKNILSLTNEKRKSEGREEKVVRREIVEAIKSGRIHWQYSEIENFRREKRVGFIFFSLLLHSF